MRRRTRNVVVASGALLGISLLIFGLGYSLYIYQNVGYPVDIAKEYLWRARATNDLYDMEFYLNKTLTTLEPYHGNPSWWFPKPDTDFDLIKQNIQTCAETCKTIRLTSNESSLGYQQAVQNLQETIIEINNHLDLAGNYVTKTLNYLIPGILISVGWIVSFIIAGVQVFRETDN